MSTMSSQELRGKALLLVHSWLQLNNNPDTDTVWDTYFPVFNKVVFECGETQQLDELLEIVFCNTLEEFADQYENTEEREMDSAFHNFLFSNVCLSMNVLTPPHLKNDSEQEQYNLNEEEDLPDDILVVDEHSLRLHQVELGGIPMFGNYEFLKNISSGTEFLNLLARTHFFNPKTKLQLIGLVPIGVAQMYMLEAQKLHNTLQVITPLMFKDAWDDSDSKTFNTLQQSITQYNAPSSEKTVGSFVLLFAYATSTPLGAESKTLRHVEDDTIDHWEEQRHQWAQEHGYNTDFVEHIGFPAPLREAIAISIADFTLQNMFLQHAIGGETSAIAQIDVVAPWNETNEYDDVSEHIVGINEQTTVYGYTPDHQLMGVVSFNAIVVSLLFSDLAHCWEGWCNVAPTFYTADEYKRYHSTEPRVLH